MGLVADFARQRCYTATNGACLAVGGSYNASTQKCQTLYSKYLAECNGSRIYVQKVDSTWNIKLSNWSAFQLYSGGVSAASSVTYGACWRDEGEWIKVHGIVGDNGTSVNITWGAYEHSGLRWTKTGAIQYDKIRTPSCNTPTPNRDLDRCFSSF
jgi:hypothetical protein